MLFLPYAMDSGKKGLPFFTVLICFICCFVYWEQYHADSRHFKAIDSFCLNSIDQHTLSMLKLVEPTFDSTRCYGFFDDIRKAPNIDQKLTELTNAAKPLKVFATVEEDRAYIYNRILESYRIYDRMVPPALTTELAYDPKDMNLGRMITSTFSHGDLIHLLGNLLFFYIFAASVELIIGNVMFALFIGASTIGTSLAYSYATANVDNALPTIGLSGVVMAGVAALAVMMPFARIRCFFWFVVVFKVFRIPAALLALWYISWDIYGMKQLGETSYINYVAHVSGAAIGALLGAYYLVFKREKLKEASVHY